MQCTRSLDIVFALDSSTSQKAYFEQSKDMIKSLATAFGVGQYGTRSSVVTFGSNVTHTIKLLDGTIIEHFHNKVDNISFTGGDTRIDMVLNFLYNASFTIENGGRVDVRKIILILTDGNQTQGANVQNNTAIADLIRNQRWKIVTLGIGESINEKELIRIAGGINNTYTVSSFIQPIKDTVSHKLFDDGCVGKLISIL